MTDKLTCRAAEHRCFSSPVCVLRKSQRVRGCIQYQAVVEEFEARCPDTADQVKPVGLILVDGDLHCRRGDNGAAGELFDPPIVAVGTLNGTHGLSIAVRTRVPEPTPARNRDILFDEPNQPVVIPDWILSVINATGIRARSQGR